MRRFKKLDTKYFKFKYKEVTTFFVYCSRCGQLKKKTTKMSKRASSSIFLNFAFVVLFRFCFVFAFRGFFFSLNMFSVPCSSPLEEAMPSILLISKLIAVKRTIRCALYEISFSGMSERSGKYRGINPPSNGLRFQKRKWEFLESELGSSNVVILLSDLSLQSKEQMLHYWFLTIHVVVSHNRDLSS